MKHLLFWNGDGTYSYNIAKIGRETKDENYDHHIIVIDEQVSKGDIDKCDYRVKKYGLQYIFFSYILEVEEMNLLN